CRWPTTGSAWTSCSCSNCTGADSRARPRRIATSAAIVLLAVLSAAAWSAPATADYVIRDRTGKRIELVDEGAGGLLLRRDLQGRRLGYIEERPGGYVLRDERGRRVGTIHRGPSGLESGVVRDPTGRRIGVIERR